MKPVLIIAVTTLLVGCGNLIKNGALVETQDALNKGHYAEALENAEIAESFGELSEADTARLHYMRAQSLEGLDRPQEAILGYRYVVNEHAKSAYAGAARQRLEALNGLAED